MILHFMCRAKQNREEQEMDNEEHENESILVSQ